MDKLSLPMEQLILAMKGMSEVCSKSCIRDEFECAILEIKKEIEESEDPIYMLQHLKPNTIILKTDTIVLFYTILLNLDILLEEAVSKNYIVEIIFY